MASPNSTFTELVSTTFRNHRKTFADNVSENNALLMRLNKKGNKRLEDGGLSIVEPLDYAENGTYQRLTKKIAACLELFVSHRQNTIFGMAL